jgi:hypothetical protein
MFYFCLDKQHIAKLALSHIGCEVHKMGLMASLK